jgi:hypothetical protein
MIHKTKVVTLIVLGLLFVHVSAQEDGFKNDPLANHQEENRKFRLGLMLNPNISWLSPNSDDYSGEGSKVGFSYGLSTEFFLSKNYLFSTGFLISSLGGEVSYEGAFEDNVGGGYVPSNVAQSFRIKYVEIPLALKLRTNEIGYMTYYGSFGLKAGVKFQSTSDFTYTDLNDASRTDKNTASDVFFLNMSLAIGAGIEYNISGNTNLLLGLTFNNGFINQLDRKLNLIDPVTDKAVLDASGNPTFTDNSGSANMNYVALNIGLFF